MSEKTQATSGGIGFGGLLTIVFIVMKLMNLGGVGAWSWWWVTCPVWIPLALVIGILILVGLFLLAAFIVACIFDR